MKRECRQPLIIASLFTAMGLFCPSAWAGGILMYDIGTLDTALSAAGWTARAQDASTVFKNPAGMSLLERSQVQMGAQLMYFDISFSPNSQTTTTGGDGGNPVGWTPAGSLFYVQKLTPDLSVGVGIFSYFGLDLKYDDNWVGRYYAQEASTIGVTFMPAVSYRITPWLSIGAGLNVTYATMKQTVAVRNFDQSDGQIKVEDEDWAYGVNVGVIVQPFKGTRIGVDYLSQMKLRFSDVPSFSGIGPGLDALLRALNAYNKSLNLGMYIPQMVMGSVYQELGSKWAVMANVGWQEWSKFGKVDVTIVNNDARSITIDAKCEDTWHVAGGVQFKPVPAWTFMAGVAYDSSAVEDQYRSVAVPIGEQYRVGLGAQWQVIKDLKLGFSYAYGVLPNMKVDQNRGPRAGRLSGEYSNFSVDFFNVNLEWQF